MKCSGIPQSGIELHLDPKVSGLKHLIYPFNPEVSGLNLPNFIKKNNPYGSG